MTFHERLISRGHWLFRHRSHLPLLMLPWLALLVWLNPERIPAMRDSGWIMICLAVAASGLLLRCLTVGCAASGTSGRNTKCQVADELNTTGMYSIVRNPLYVGNYLMLLAPVLFVRSPWAVVVFTLVFWLYYERIVIAEESFLRERYGKSYQDFAARVPVFLPNPFLWKAPTKAPCPRRMVRREYCTQLSMVSSLMVMDSLSGYMQTGSFMPGLFIQKAMMTSIGIFLIVWLLVKRTKLLK
jgi:protein-S-isoprenylcysteine O-methyltransferase Ste14